MTKTQIKITLKTREDVMTFGRYKGRTIEEMLEEAPDYLCWAHENIDWFVLEPGVLEEACENAANLILGKEEPPFWAMLNDEPPY